MLTIHFNKTLSEGQLNTQTQQLLKLNDFNFTT